MTLPFDQDVVPGHAAFLPPGPAADAPARPQSERARGLKGARYALLKNPEDLTEHQGEKLAWIVKASAKSGRMDCTSHTGQFSVCVRSV